MAKETERKLPDGALEIDFIICDNTLNRKGWRLLVQGIDLAGFLKNPVCCVQHDTWMIPVGKWKNLRIENDQLLGSVEFDRNDPEAVRLYWKYKDGYMNAVSLHVIPLEESDVPAMLVPGQRYATITKSEMLEISLVTVPGQKNAVKLSTPDGLEYKLNVISKNEDQMSKEEKPAVTGDEELKQELEKQKKLNAKNLIRYHKQRGVVQDGEVEHLEALAADNYDTVEKMLDARQEVEKKSKDDMLDAKTEEGKKLADTVKNFTQNASGGKKTGGDDRAGWSYYDWFRKDPDGLAAMAENDPEKHKQLQLDFQNQAKKNNLKFRDEE